MTDSGGTPWAGRDLAPEPYAGDDGRPDARLATALSRLGRLRGDDSLVAGEVVDAISGARLFVAVVALTGPASDMALVTLTRPDGRRALPVFSSPETLAAWRADGRPVPAEGRRVALSAVAEECDLLDLDPGGPVRFVVPRPALWAIAQGRSWAPSYANPAVQQEVSRICQELGLVAHCRRGTTAELSVVVRLASGLDADAVGDLTDRLSRRIGESQIMADGVDSLAIVIRPA